MRKPMELLIEDYDTSPVYDLNKAFSTGRLIGNLSPSQFPLFYWRSLYNEKMLFGEFFSAIRTNLKYETV